MNNRQDIASDKRGLTVEEFGRFYGVGRTAAFAEIAAGRLKALKLGRRTIIAREEADRWLANLPARRVIIKRAA